MSIYADKWTTKDNYQMIDSLVKVENIFEGCGIIISIRLISKRFPAYICLMLSHSTEVIYPDNDVFTSGKFATYIHEIDVLNEIESDITTFCISPACITGRGSSIRSQFAWHASGPEFDPHVQHILPWRLGHENISTAILPLSLIQEEQLSVTGDRMCTKY